jgi:hypothetical protein
MYSSPVDSQASLILFIVSSVSLWW